MMHLGGSGTDANDCANSCVWAKDGV
eukprot:COSAG01_NODE_23800_length_801_cov_1.356125_3_plen_25_part_01